MPLWLCCYCCWTLSVDDCLCVLIIVASHRYSNHNAISEMNMCLHSKWHWAMKFKEQSCDEDEEGGKHESKQKSVFSCSVSKSNNPFQCQSQVIYKIEFIHVWIMCVFSSFQKSPKKSRKNLHWITRHWWWAIERASK